MADDETPATRQCGSCGEQIKIEAKKCPYCGEDFLWHHSLADDWQIPGPWLTIIWGSMFVPFAGAVVILIISITRYDVWKKEHPRRARAASIHGWTAGILNVLLWGIILFSYWAFGWTPFIF